MKAGAEITVTLEGGEHFVTVIRLGRAVSTYDRPSFGLTPLTEMTAAERYKGEDGGLYGAGRNDPPPAHSKAALRETARIAPLGADGTPTADGTIALLTIGIGPNARLGAAMQEFSYPDLLDPANGAVRARSCCGAAARLDALRARFEQALGQRRSSDPSFAAAEVLYAYGTNPGGGHPT